MLAWFYLLFLGVLFIATLILGVYSLVYKSSENFSLLKVKLMTRLLVILSIAFVGIALTLPLFISKVFEIINQDIGDYKDIGTALSGLMGPFIAIAGVIVTGLAFYMQYQANQQIRRQFKIQQFESQFYEMLKLHKQNVEEMELTVYQEKVNRDENGDLKKSSYEYVNPKLVKGRKVFTHYVQEFHLLLSSINISDFEVINKESFLVAYIVFFGGEEKLSTDDDFRYNTLINASQAIIRKTKLERLSENRHLHEYFDLFRGHVEYLGHYYRHLYMTVKYVIESYEKDKIIKSHDCLKYLKVLRAQLSNAEQVMLFYNWVAGYGAKWEIGEKRYYFSKYLMLHNLDFGMLFPWPNHYIKKKVKEIYDRSTDKNNLFELNVSSYLQDFVDEDCENLIKMELEDLVELGEKTYPEKFQAPRDTLISDQKAAFDNIINIENVGKEISRLNINQCELFAYTLLIGFTADKIQLPFIRNRSPNEFIKSIICFLDSFLNKCDRTDAGILYRQDKYSDASKFKEGCIVTIKNYFVTSLDDFGWDNCIVWVITTFPERTKARAGYKIYEHCNEKQVTFERGAKFRIDCIEEKDNVTYFHCHEVI